MAATRKRTRKPRADEMDAEVEQSTLEGGHPSDHDHPLADALLDAVALLAKVRVLWHEASPRERKAYAPRLHELFAVARSIPAGDVPAEARVGFDPARTGSEAVEWPEARR